MGDRGLDHRAGVQPRRIGHTRRVPIGAESDIFRLDNIHLTGDRLALPILADAFSIACRLHRFQAVDQARGPVSGREIRAGVFGLPVAGK